MRNHIESLILHYTNIKEMPIVRITKEFRFEGAHALNGYDGKCRHIHGHSYLMYVTIKGRPLENETHPKNGMLIDFGILKRIVNENIVEKFDHALVMKKDSVLSSEIQENYGNVIITDFQPTSENLICHFAEILKDKLPAEVELSAIRLYETATSYAEWLSEDNQ